MRIFYNKGVEGAFLSNIQSPEAIKDVFDIFDLIKRVLRGNKYCEQSKTNYRLEKYLFHKCQEANFLNIPKEVI